MCLQAVFRKTIIYITHYPNHVQNAKKYFIAIQLINLKNSGGLKWIDIIKLALIGATGRFSSDILTEIEYSNSFLLSNAVTREGNQFVGQNISLISEYKKTNVVISEKFNNMGEVDVIVDVTVRDAFINNNAIQYERLKKPLVIATTAFTDEDLLYIKELSELFL